MKPMSCDLRGGGLTLQCGVTCVSLVGHLSQTGLRGHDLAETDISGEAELVHGRLLHHHALA